MTELKLRLKLKWNRKKIDYLVHQNFGYSPSNSPAFDKFMDLENELLDIARVEYPSLYIDFIDSH
jgi:hypothetical protein